MNTAPEEFPPYGGAVPDMEGPPPFSPYLSAPPPPVPLPLAKEIQDEIAEFAVNWMRSSRNYVKGKEFDWLIAKQLYEGEIGIREWEQLVEDRDTIEDEGETPDEEAYSDYIHDMSPIVNQWVDMAHSMIFGGPQYVVVEPVGKDADPISAMDLTKLLTGRLEEAQFEARGNDALRDLVLYGTVATKTSWHWRADSARKHLDPATGATFEQEPEPWNEGPLTQIIPLTKFLPDWRATHNDVQRWRGVGHRVTKTYDDIMLGFDRGIYTLHRDELEERFSRTDGGNAIEEDQLAGDEDGLVEDDPNNWLDVWEWHGQASTSRGSYEVVVTVITEQDSDDPSGGVVVRITDGPALDMGRRKLRPFAVAHYHQRKRPFGVGLYSSSRGTLHTISRLVGMFIDNLHVVLNSPIGVDPGSPAWLELQKTGGRLGPGKKLPIEPGNNPFTEIPRLNYPSSENLNAIEFFGRILEEQTLTNASRGLESASRQTAMEVSALMQQSQTPAEVRVRLFCQNCLNLALTMSLYLVRIFSDEDQVHWQPMNGEYEQTIVPLEVLQGPGEYRAFAAITRQDATSNVKAQTLQQLLGQAESLTMLMQAQGWQINWAEFVTQLFHRMNLDNIDRLITPAPPPPPMPPGMIPGAPMQPEMQGPPMQGPPPEIPPGMQGTPMGPPTDIGQEALQTQMQSAQGTQPWA